MKMLKFGLVGIGGFGKRHLESIRVLEDLGKVKLVAVCDSDLGRYRNNLEELSFKNVRKYDSFDKFLEDERELDLVIITTPIPLHKEMCCKAMKAGNNVLLEKPPAVTIQDIDEMIRVKTETGKFCSVDFQETSRKSFIEFKKELLKGKIGKIISVSSAGIWKRTLSYFNRSEWAGKITFNGNYVLDGTINNPLSHLLNNSMVLADLQEEADSTPDWVQAELYRANNIEGEDTSCLRIVTKGGIKVMFFATLCHSENTEPYIIVNGSEGKALFRYRGSMEYWDLHGNVTGELKMEENAHLEHYKNLVDFMQGNAFQLSCQLEDARNFVLLTNLAFESSGKTHNIDKKYTEFHNIDGNTVDKNTGKEDYIYVKNISDYISMGIKENKLFSEMDVEWAVKTEPFYGKGYEKFKLFK